MKNTMSLHTSSALLLVGLLALAGCATPPPIGLTEHNPRRSVYSALLDQGMKAAPVDETYSGPMIEVMVESLTVERKDAENIGLAFDASYKKLTPDQWKTMEHAVQASYRGAVFTLFSGSFRPRRRAYFDYDTPIRYVEDVDVWGGVSIAPIQHEPTIEALSHELGEGMVALDIRASLDANGRVAITHLLPRVATRLGIRRCRAHIVVDGEKQPLYWEEDEFGVFRPRLQNPCSITLNPDDVLVIPLEVSVERVAGTERAQAHQGKVSEEYVPGAPFALEDRQYFFVLRARVRTPND